MANDTPSPQQDNVAKILARLAPEQAKATLSYIAKRDLELARTIAGRMFTFEEIGDLTDASFPVLMKEVPRAILLLAMKRAPAPVLAKIFGNLSKNAARILQQEYRETPPAKASDVAQAQTEVARAAKALLDQGKIDFEEGV